MALEPSARARLVQLEDHAPLRVVRRADWGWRLINGDVVKDSLPRSFRASPLWAAWRVKFDQDMERRVLDKPEFKLLGGVAQEKIDTIRSIIQSAPPGRDAIAGTIATLVAVSAALFSSVTSEWRKTAKQHEFVFAALDSLLRDVVVMRYRDLPWNLWYDDGLVKSK